MDRITNTFLQPNKKEIIVHKIFWKENNEYLSMFLHSRPSFQEKLRQFRFAPLDEWISCYIDYNGIWWNNKLIYAPSGIQYSVGFHSYLDIDESIIVFNNYIKKYLTGPFTLCECRAKFRLYEGIEENEIDYEILSAKMIISRGIKIIKEIK